MRKAADEDVDMAGGAEAQPRKVVKAKRRLPEMADTEQKLVDENGEEISFEDDDDDWEDDVEYIDE